MNKRITVVAMAAIAIVLAFGAPARADDPPTRVARVSHVDGDVSLQPGDSDDWTWASLNRPLTTGDSLWVDKGARAEIRIGSAAVRASENTSLSLLNLDDRSAQFGLNSGTIIVHVTHIPDQGYFEIDTPNVAVSLTQPGDYRINAADTGDFTALDVRKGAAQVTGTRMAFKVTAGSEAEISGAGDNLSYDFYDLPSADAFDNWSRMRDWRVARARSARYVSPELTGYEDLDANGSWVQDPQYGEVWQPAHVSSDWSPYRNGHWAWIEPWGWSWVDDEPWGFATSHYGRWAYRPAGTWVWVPPRAEEVQASWPVYSPANVIFIQNTTVVNYNAPVVSWIPLAPGEAYVPAYQCSRDYMQRLNRTNTIVAGPGIIFEENRTVSPRAFRNLVAASAVVAVSQQAFASAQPVGKATLRVNVAAVTSRPAAATAPVAPVKASAVPSPAGRPAAAAPKPPQQVAQRRVVVKETPPPKPVPFEKKQQLLQKNAGKPLAPDAEKSLRAQAPAPAVVKAAVAPETAPAPETQRKPRPAQMHGYGRLEPAPQQGQPAAQTPQESRQQQRQQEQEQRKADQQQKQEEQQQLRQQQEEQQKTQQQQRQQEEEQRKADQQQKQEEQQQLRQQQEEQQKAQQQQEEEQRKADQQQKREEQQQLRQQQEEQQKAQQQQRQQEEEQRKADQQQKQEEQQQLRPQEQEQQKPQQPPQEERQQQRQQEEEQRKADQQQKQEEQQQLRQDKVDQQKADQDQKQKEQQLRQEKADQQKADQDQKRKQDQDARQKKLDDERKAREEKQQNGSDGQGQPSAP